MDIEKLKSIIRLANNNPNENEANLAARKACKILAENDFAIFGGARASGKTATNATTWNDVRRSAEPQWRSKTYDPPPGARYQSPFTGSFWDEFWKHAQKNPTPGRTPWDMGDPPRYEAPKPPKAEKKVRKCSQCGKEVETKRVTTIFTCNECEWEAYQKANQPKPKKDRTKIPYCRFCKGPMNFYNIQTDSWSCACGQSYISAIEAAARGIKFK